MINTHQYRHHPHRHHHHPQLNHHRRHISRSIGSALINSYYNINADMITIARIINIVDNEQYTKPQHPCRTTCAAHDKQPQIYRTTNSSQTPSPST
jgi:hypothetical protein